MHIAEGVLGPPILALGGALSLAGCALGLRRLDENRIIPVALLSAAFFTASLVHVPIGPVSAHLILNGLLGVLLGWAAFPAIAVALLLQALLFQYGGLTTLGVNTLNMALPAILAGYLARPWLNREGWPRFFSAFCCGMCGVAGAAILTALSLGFTDEGFATAAKVLMFGHLPVAVAEGLVTASAVAFLAKVRPALLQRPHHSV
ncbi:MAG: cobalt transporter CbiM [Desulfobulbaceae bacterium]|nr:cobalt transporter CbiM [Desulfobulbaceae bacterium]